MKKYIIIALGFISFLLNSCDDVNVTGISLNKSTMVIPEKGVGKLVATIEPSNAFGNVTWTSSNPSIATVKEDGTVTGVSAGTATITATTGSHSVSCSVTVSAEITSIALDKSVLKLKVDSATTLKVTLLPASSDKVKANIIWTSTNPAVATVDANGKVTAVADGSASIVASIGTVTAICPISVYSVVPQSLLGSNYYLIMLDTPTSTDLISSSKVVADYRVNDQNNNFYIWNGLKAGSYTGVNFYGNANSWLSLEVTGAGGWSGAAYNVKSGSELNKLKAATDDTSDKYYLHFAIKSFSDKSFLFGLASGKTEAKIVLGATAMEGIAPYGNFTRNGQWQEVEIPISVFKAKGLSYTTGMSDTNIFMLLAGGTAGVKLEMDAIFIYKKP